MKEREQDKHTKIDRQVEGSRYTGQTSRGIKIHRTIFSAVFPALNCTESDQAVITIAMMHI